MIEPRAWYVDNYGIYWREGRQPESIKFPSTFLPSPDMPDPPRTLLKLTTVADVLASLREPSEAMIEAATQTGVDCDACIRTQYSVSEVFLAMLDAWEKENMK